MKREVPRRGWFAAGRPGLPVVLLLALTALGLGVAPVWADIFELKDGRKLEGTVIGEFGSLISIKTAAGAVVTVEKAEIERRRETNTVIDRYLERKASLVPRDLAGHLELARWCLEQRLDREAVAHFKRALSIDPAQAEARAALGYVQVRGEWYLEGPEAQRARQGEPDPFAVPLQEIPDDVSAAKLRRQLQPKPRSGGSKPPAPIGGRPVIGLELEERVQGKPPETSGMSYLLRGFLDTMEAPMALTSGAGVAGYRMKIDVNVRFVRTHMFYKRLPLYHVFEGVAKVELVEVGKESKPLVQIRAVCPFSAGVSTPKEDAALYAYHRTLQTVLFRLSQARFFKQRGARPQKDPRQ